MGVERGRDQLSGERRHVPPNRTDGGRVVANVVAGAWRAYSRPDRCNVRVSTDGFVR